MLDLIDSPVSIKPRYIITGAVFLISLTVTLVAGWLSLKAEAAEAKDGVQSLRIEVRTIKCLMTQQNDYIIHKIKPSFSCQ